MRIFLIEYTWVEPTQSFIVRVDGNVDRGWDAVAKVANFLHKRSIKIVPHAHENAWRCLEITNLPEFEMILNAATPTWWELA